MAVHVVVEQLLPLADHAQALIVDDQHLHRQLRGHQGGQFGGAHLKAAVADDRPDGAARQGGLDAHRRWQRIAHRAQSTAGQQLSGAVKTVV